MEIRNWIQQLTVREISIVMLIVTLVVPFFNMPSSGHMWGGEHVNNVRVLALLWQLEISYWIIGSETGVTIVGLDILNPLWFLSSAIMGCFNILFALQVVRFCKKQTSKRWTIVIGILTVIFPFIFGLPGRFVDMYYFMVEGGFLLYVGPIPIQLIIGLIIMRYAGPWKVTKPWDDEEKSREDWWNKTEETREEES